MVGKMYRFYYTKHKFSRDWFDFEKVLKKLLKNLFYGKTMENVRNRVISGFIKKQEFEKKIKQQSKLTINGFHKSYTSYDS